MAARLMAVRRSSSSTSAAAASAAAAATAAASMAAVPALGSLRPRPAAGSVHPPERRPAVRLASGAAAAVLGEEGAASSPSAAESRVMRRGPRGGGEQPRCRHGRLDSWKSPQRKEPGASAPLFCTAASAPVATEEDKRQADCGQASTRPNVIRILRERGLVDAVTSDELEAAAGVRTLRVYCGFDPTADSLHLGNLLGIIVLDWFQRCGHEPIALVGGATGRVGDPSGRSVERPVMDDDTINSNLAGIQQILERLLGRASPSGQGPPVVNNLDWFGGIGFLEFLRDVGKFARVGTMLSRDSVKSRLNSETGMSFTEFTYQLLQGYDFVHLYKEMGVRVQVGGSDQWGNIIAGTDLIQKILRQDGAYGLTFPLLLKSDGTKFGKSVSGALWLAPEKLSPYQFYQYLVRTTDADVVKFLRILTFLDLEEIAAIEAAMAAPGYHPNTAQRRLAEEVTRYVHGEEGLQQALAATASLAPGAETKLDASALEAIAGDVPSVTLPKMSVVGQPLLDVLVAAGLVPSKGEGKRLVKGGGVYLNNAKVTDDKLAVADADAVEGRLLLLSAGKKRKLLVRLGGGEDA